VKLALGQIRVDGGKPDANVARAEGAIAEAALAGAQMIVLPEALDCGWTDSSARNLAGAIPGGIACERLRTAASGHRIFVCAGIVERAGDLLFNAALLISPEGALLLHHRKIHELDIAHDLYARGDRLAVAATSLGIVGVMICADAFAPGLCISRALGAMGAEIIVSPCAWAVGSDHNEAREPYGKLWQESYGPVACEYGLTIAGVSNVGPIRDGPWAGRECIGCSLIIGSDGSQLLRGPFGTEADTLLFSDVASERNDRQISCGGRALTRDMPLHARDS
jgi:predicted amidohydrolase